MGQKNSCAVSIATVDRDSQERKEAHNTYYLKFYLNIHLNYLLKKTVILITNNNMPSSDNKESLFGIDFDIDTPINTEVKHQKSRTFIKPGDEYPLSFKGMTRKDFTSWNLSHNQEFVADRGINKSGYKHTLVTNAYNAYKMNLEISVTDYMEENNEVEDCRMKSSIKIAFVKWASKSTRSLKINR